MTAVDPASFGRAVRRARLARGMTQEALGDAAGLATKHVSVIELGELDVRLSTIAQLAAGLGMAPGRLLYLAEECAARRGDPLRRLAHSTFRGRPALLVHPLDATSQILALDLVNDALARAAARDYATRAHARGDSTTARELLDALAEPVEPVPAPARPFVLNAKQRARLKQIDASGGVWHAPSGGNARMADVLDRHGLLTGPHQPGRFYVLTDAGCEAARDEAR